VEAVANVVLNRVAKKFRGRTTVRDVCLHRKQFSCWNGNDTNRAKIMNLVKGSNPEFDRCLAVATRAIKGQFPDHTDGALHYFATRIPKPDWVVNSPKAKPTLKIGGHIFYKGID
jgi:spore germination cell wall hydrolase CwlJ-like protein